MIAQAKILHAAASKHNIWCNPKMLAMNNFWVL